MLKGQVIGKLGEQHYDGACDAWVDADEKYRTSVRGTRERLYEHITRQNVRRERPTARIYERLRMDDGGRQVVWREDIMRSEKQDGTGPYGSNSGKESQYLGRPGREQPRPA